MSSSKLNDWLQILASVGVLAGLLFLALEIRQSNRIAIAATEVTVREAWGSSNESVYSNPELVALLSRARSPDVEFSDEEREMTAYYFARMTNIWRGIEEAHANEMISRVTLDAAIEDIDWTVKTYPGMRPQFEDWLRTYPSVADSEVASQISRSLGKK